MNLKYCPKCTTFHLKILSFLSQNASNLCLPLTPEWTTVYYIRCDEWMSDLQHCLFFQNRAQSGSDQTEQLYYPHLSLFSSLVSCWALAKAFLSCVTSPSAAEYFRFICSSLHCHDDNSSCKVLHFRWHDNNLSCFSSNSPFNLLEKCRWHMRDVTQIWCS